MKYNIFLLIFSIQIILATKNFLDTCNNKNLKNYLILFFHHLLDVYVFFGPLFLESKNGKQLHFIIILLLLFHWVTNDYRCWLTVYLNELCLEDQNKWLYSLMSLLSKITNIYYLHSYWILILFFGYLFNKY